MQERRGGEQGLRGGVPWLRGGVPWLCGSYPAPCSVPRREAIPEAGLELGPHQHLPAPNPKKRAYRLPTLSRTRSPHTGRQHKPRFKFCVAEEDAMGSRQSRLTWPWAPCRYWQMTAKAGRSSTTPSPDTPLPLLLPPERTQHRPMARPRGAPCAARCLQGRVQGLLEALLLLELEQAGIPADREPHSCQHAQWDAVSLVSAPQSEKGRFRLLAALPLPCCVCSSMALRGGGAEWGWGAVTWPGARCWS